MEHSQVLPSLRQQHAASQLHRVSLSPPPPPHHFGGDAGDLGLVDRVLRSL